MYSLRSDLENTPKNVPVFKKFLKLVISSETFTCNQLTAVARTSPYIILGHEYEFCPRTSQTAYLPIIFWLQLRVNITL